MAAARGAPADRGDALWRCRPPARHAVRAGWLLTHHLLRDATRAAALRGYLAAIRTPGGVDEKAFTTAFGTSYHAMDRTLADYARTGLSYTVIPLKPLAGTDVAVTPMSEASDDLLFPRSG